MKHVSIGTLARQTGVKIPTIRYYESIGLLPSARRLPNNRRAFGPDHCQRLRLIRHARDLGFDIESIRQLLDIAREPDGPCSEADAIARAHLGAIEQKIERLKALRAELQGMLRCKNHKVAECRVIEGLADHGLWRVEHARAL